MNTSFIGKGLLPLPKLKLTPRDLETQKAVVPPKQSTLPQESVTLGGGSNAVRGEETGGTTVPTTSSGRSEEAPVEKALDKALAGTTLVAQDNGSLVDLGQPIRHESSAGPNLVEMLNLNVPDETIQSKVSTGPSFIKSPADPKTLKEPAPTPVVWSRDQLYQPTVEIRVRPDDAKPGETSSPDFVTRREAAISALEAAIEGKEVTGGLKAPVTDRTPRPYVEPGRFRVEGLDGEMVILELDRKPEAFLRSDGPQFDFTPLGKKADQISGKQGAENGLYQVHRDDFAAMLDTAFVRKPL